MVLGVTIVGSVYVTTSVFNTASKWLCNHCKSLNHLQSMECKMCSLPKTYIDLMASAVSGGKTVCGDFPTFLCSLCQYIVNWIVSKSSPPTPQNPGNEAINVVLILLEF